MGSKPHSRPWHNGTIEDCEIKEPRLYNREEVDQPMLDIREEANKARESGIIGESGAEAFFCNTTVCIKEKNDALKLSGLQCHDDLIMDLFKEKCEQYKRGHDRIKDIREEQVQQEKLLEALALKIGYDAVSFSEYGVKVSRGLLKQNFPSIYDNRGRRIENYGDGWDA
jgi:hypothetical protein